MKDDDNGFEGRERGHMALKQHLTIRVEISDNTNITRDIENGLRVYSVVRI